MATAEGELQAAVQALYHHPDPKVKDQANRWLEDWQQRVEAWQVADQVLHDGSASMEAHYFAAQTLRTKAIPPSGLAPISPTLTNQCHVTQVKPERNSRAARLPNLPPLHI